jgi:hypothetical protein
MDERRTGDEVAFIAHHSVKLFAGTPTLRVGPVSGPRGSMSALNIAVGAYLLIPPLAAIFLQRSWHVVPNGFSAFSAGDLTQSSKRTRATPGRRVNVRW